MRGEIERCRQQVDNAWLRAEEARLLEVLGVGKLGALIRNRRKQRQRRRDRPMTPFVAERIAERAAASPPTTLPGQPKTDGEQAQSRPVTPPPPLRQKEARYAWQAADGTATGG